MFVIRTVSTTRRRSLKRVLMVPPSLSSSSSSSSLWNRIPVSSLSSLATKHHTSPAVAVFNRETHKNDIHNNKTQVWDAKRTESVTSPSSSSLPTFTIGILRETYDQWERRAPLTPDQCHDLLHPTTTSGSSNTQIIVQPSSRRIFSDQQYIDAGAIVQESLHDADIVLGVKRPHPTVNIQDLFQKQQMVMFFSHVIKGQPENMKLLQDLLDHHVQLIDYEKITVPNSNRRLVAFGKYAGLAGMIDTLSIVGQRLLRSHSLSTPFLNCPPSIYHASLQDAKATVQRVGERISMDGISSIPSMVRTDSPMGAPTSDRHEPLVFCLTGGPRGNVYSGVKEIFDLLPHEVVGVEDLPTLYEEVANDPSSAIQHKVYCVTPETKDLYGRIEDDGVTTTSNIHPFDRSHFTEHPELYRSKFAQTIAPYTHVLVNSIYWERRFPRLLTKDDMFDLYDSFGNERLMVVSDISCDIEGSIEFLERSTSIDRPCFQYDPIARHESSSSVGDFGVTVAGVDILPSELPKESSKHFGTALGQVLPDLILAKTANEQNDENNKSRTMIDTMKLSSPLSSALITTEDGSLASNFKYLAPIVEHSMKHSSVVDVQSMSLALEGHLFDSNLINHVLDILEMNDCECAFKECNVQYRPKGDAPIKSNVVLEITAGKDVDMDVVQSKIHALVEAMIPAEATVRRIDYQGCQTGRSGSTSSFSSTAFVEDESTKKKKVLLLGSGRVSMSVVDWLGRSPGHEIVVASNNDDEARAVAALAQNGKSSHASLDIVNDNEGLTKLVNTSDLVISLLPASMHPKVAEMCIDAQTDLVTASYESDEMRDLGERAESAGIRVMNEVGLDPGLDHMSAMKIIDDIKDRGGYVTTFSSVCGGLPAPEAAGNPLKYKFSWSPRGVITASQNDAQYLLDGRVIQVRGNELLTSASPFTDEWSDLDLECLPNRNSLNYRETYGIDQARTIFRGTLRYAGFSSLMHVLQTSGFFDTSTPIDNLATWDEVLDTLRQNRGGFDSIYDFFLACAGEDGELAQRTMDALTWLDMYGDSSGGGKGSIKSPHDRSIVDMFCKRLEERLKFGPDERDMVVMHHKIGAEFEDGSIEEHHSSLQVFGTESTMTAMCKTVGYPTAVAASLILDGKLDDCKPGLLLPTTKQIYLPILDAVQQEGINFDERCFSESGNEKKVG